MHPLGRASGTRWILLGPFLTVCVVALTEGLSRAGGRIPNPPALLILTVVVSAFSGGLPAGLLSAAVAWVYAAYFFSLPSHPFQYTEENLLRIAWEREFPAPAEKACYLVEAVERIGAEPFRPPDPLPPIEREEIHLITWMAIEPERPEGAG